MQCCGVESVGMIEASKTVVTDSKVETRRWRARDERDTHGRLGLVRARYGAEYQVGALTPSMRLSMHEGP